MGEGSEEVQKKDRISRTTDMKISRSLKSEHSSSESTTFTTEFGKIWVLLADPDSAVKNRKVSSLMKQTLGFSLNSNNSDCKCCLLPVGIIAVWGILFGP